MPEPDAAVYPDAVTLVSRPPADELLSGIDTSPGCSVKDSFGVLDLSPHGFRVLFEAEWIARPDTGPVTAAGHPHWRRIGQPEDLVRWQEACQDGAGPDDLLRARLLSHDQVAVLAAEQDNQIVAGAILTASPAVVGISNVFARPGAATDPWPGCLALTRSLFPGLIIVGYEPGDDLAHAKRHGFEPIGRLRVWINGAPRDRLNTPARAPWWRLSSPAHGMSVPGPWAALSMSWSRAGGKRAGWASRLTVAR